MDVCSLKFLAIAFMGVRKCSRIMIDLLDPKKMASGCKGFQLAIF
jgi:hypothetical protein